MKQKKGRMPCETCSNDVVVKVNELDTLSYRCDECDAAPYARKGTGQHAAWLRKMGVGAENTPAAEKPQPKETKPSAGAGFFG